MTLRRVTGPVSLLCCNGCHGGLRGQWVLFGKIHAPPRTSVLLQPGKGGGRHLICTPALESPWHQFPCYYSLGKAKSGQLYRKVMDNFCLQNFKGKPG